MINIKFLKLPSPLTLFVSPSVRSVIILQISFVCEKEEEKKIPVAHASNFSSIVLIMPPSIGIFV